MKIESATTPDKTLRAFERLKKALIDPAPIVGVQTAAYCGALGRMIHL